MVPVPSTVVRILHNVPWNSSYNDVLTFGSLSQQTQYFVNKSVYTFTNFTYQRYNPDRGDIAAIRVPIEAEKLYTCNYVMFQNAGHGSKWFYAFIKEINYINEGMTELVYEIDVMQTYKFDYTIKECFVEREHTNNDAIGANLVPENVELGEYVSSNYRQVGALEPDVCAICVAATFDMNFNDSGGGVYGHLYSGLAMNFFADITALKKFIQDANTLGKSDGIVAIFPFPAAFIPPEGAEKPLSLTLDVPKRFSDIDGYHPRNNKLFTYPYNFLYVSNNAGNAVNWRWEFFPTDPVQLKVFGVLSCNPEFCMAPVNYKTVGGPDDINPNEIISLSGFPQSPYITDTYKVYLAQNLNQIRLNTDAAIVNAVTDAVTLNARGLANTLYSVSSMLARHEDMDVLPPQAHNNNAKVTLYGAGLNNFSVYDMYITKYYAQIIDSYFDMFGYATHLVKKPNVTGRRYWNYVKCQNAHIVGDIPIQYLNRINQVFNDGCTFWHDDDIGNYSRTNSIV